MTLPVGSLARSTFDLAGQTIAIRSLSRTEAFQLKKLTDDVDEAEIQILIMGTDSTREEVAAFRASQPAGGIEELIAAILKLSGLEAEVTENGSGPKA